VKQRFLHVWHGNDQTIIDSAINEWRGPGVPRRRLRACVQTKSGHFEQLMWQYFLDITTISYFKLSEGSAATYWRYVGKYYMSFVGNLLGFQQWKNFENPLRIDKVWCTIFWDTVYVRRCSWWGSRCDVTSTRNGVLWTTMDTCEHGEGVALAGKKDARNSNFKAFIAAIRNLRALTLL